MELTEIIQTIYGLALAIILLIYGNRWLNTMAPSEPKEKK